MTYTSDWFTVHTTNWKKYLSDTTKYLEIGSYEGRSSIWMYDNLCQDVTCVDVWRYPEVEQRFDENICGRQIKKIKAPSEQAFRSFDNETFDCVYIDGSHEARDVLADAVNAYRVCKYGGILVFDDYPWDSETTILPPKPAIDAFLALYPVETLFIGWQVFVRKTENGRYNLQNVRTVRNAAKHSRRRSQP